MPVQSSYFNPRFPRGKRQPSFTSSRRQAIFQSTLPAGEATRRTTRPTVTMNYFNPRFPRGKRRRSRWRACWWNGFQSTLPAGEATFVDAPLYVIAAISIHASRGGSDKDAIIRGFNVKFQSTLPAGEATSLENDKAIMDALFQSTLPAGEATGAFLTHTG